MMPETTIHVLPGVDVDPATQTAYVDCARFADWFGAQNNAQLQEAILLAALRAMREHLSHTKIRQYVVKGGK